MLAGWFKKERRNIWQFSSIDRKTKNGTDRRRRQSDGHCAAAESVSCEAASKKTKKQNIHNVALFPRVTVGLSVCVFVEKSLSFREFGLCSFFRLCEKKNRHSTKAIEFEEKSKKHLILFMFSPPPPPCSASVCECLCESVYESARFPFVPRCC